MDSRYEPVPTLTVGEGVLQGYSTVLNLLIRWDHGQLGWHDPETGCTSSDTRISKPGPKEKEPAPTSSGKPAWPPRPGSGNWRLSWSGAGRTDHSGNGPRTRPQGTASRPGTGSDLGSNPGPAPQVPGKGFPPHPRGPPGDLQEIWPAAPGPGGDEEGPGGTPFVGEIMDQLTVIVGLDEKARRLIPYAGRSIFVTLILISFALALGDAIKLVRYYKSNWRSNHDSEQPGQEDGQD